MSEQQVTLQSWMYREIEHHRRWRRIWSVAFFGTAALTVICGAATTAVAGLADPEKAQTLTIVLAAATTVLASLEKVLRLREKWDLHRNIQTSLEMTELKRAAGIIDDVKAIETLDKIAQSYSTQLAELSAPSQPANNATAAAGQGGNGGADGGA
jgi:hypothetical protein